MSPFFVLICEKRPEFVLYCTTARSRVTAMNPRRLIHLILGALGLAMLGASWWWATRRLSPLSTLPQIPATAASAAGEIAAPAIKAPVKVAPLKSVTADRISAESPEGRAQRTRFIALERDLAQSQESELSGLEEREYASALAALAHSQGEAIAALTAARNELLNPSGAQVNPAPLADAEALRARFEAVRRSIIEDGLSAEEAESLFETARPGP